MNTRRAKDDSVFHQNRYASSSEFERGLLGNLVAKRVSVLDDKADRELIWFLQHLSHQEGGLTAVAADLLSKYPDRLGTKAMVEIGKRAGKTCTADEVGRVRNELPRELRSRFPLRGEIARDVKMAIRHERLARRPERARELLEMADEATYRYVMLDENRKAELDAMDAQEQKDSQKNPTAYPASVFFDLCREAAEHGFDYEGKTDCLEKELCRLCLDPGWEIASTRPWYFASLIDTLRKYHRQSVEAKSDGVVVTALGTIVHETLDYTLHSKSMTLVEGDARTGKTFSARSWCERHPGLARFVETPTGNDDKGFFRALARGLGLGNFQQYKALEIRERVESVLLTGDILLCLDEAHRLWPEVNLWRGFPRRINWVMSMANQNVPICMIATPQFIERQMAAQQFAGWNSAQFIGRLGHRERLPSELSLKDLVAVAESVLPEADAQTLRALAAYARTSARYLAAIDAITKRARYIAARTGRPQCNADDVRTAMKESVIPSDTRLVRTLENVGKTKHGRRAAPPAPENLPPAPAMETFEAVNSRIGRRAGVNRLTGARSQPLISQ